MMTHDEFVVSGVTASILTFLIGEITIDIQVLLVCAVVNYALGVVVAIKKKELCSQRALDGIFKFFALFSVLVLAHQFTKLGNFGELKTPVTYFFISYYGISILENSGIVGLPLPKKLKSMLKALNESKKA